AFFVLVLGSAITTAAQKQPTNWKAHAGWVAGLAVTADGKTLASVGSDRKVRLWDTASGKARATLVGHTDTVSAVAFDFTGQVLATADTVSVWPTRVARA